MRRIKLINLIVMTLGGFIMFAIAIIAINDSHATNLLSAIPSSIVGAALFIAGYLGLNINEKGR